MVLGHYDCPICGEGSMTFFIKTSHSFPSRVSKLDSSLNRGLHSLPVSAQLSESKKKKKSQWRFFLCVRASFHYNKTRLFYRIESGLNWSHSKQQKLLLLTSSELALWGVSLGSRLGCLYSKTSVKYQPCWNRNASQIVAEVLEHKTQGKHRVPWHVALSNA